MQLLSTLADTYFGGNLPIGIIKKNGKHLFNDGSAHTLRMSAHQQFETYLFLKIRVMNINNRQIPHRVSPKRSYPY